MVASISARFNGCMEPALRVGLPPACENVETHSLWQFIVSATGFRDKRNQMSTSQTAVELDRQILSTTAFLFHCACPHVLLECPHISIKNFPVFLCFLPNFRYLILKIRPDTHAYMRVPSRSYAAIVHLAQVPGRAYDASTLQIPTLDYL